MSFLDTLANIARPLTARAATPLRKMSDADLAAAISDCRRELDASNAKLQRLEPQLAEAAAEAFAGAEPAAVTRNSQAVAQARTALDGLRTTLVGLEAEQTRRAVEAETDACTARHKAQQANHDRVAELVGQVEQRINELGPLVIALRAAVATHYGSLSPAQRDRLGAVGRPSAVGGELTVALARVTNGFLGHFQCFTPHEASMRPSLAEQVAQNRHVLAMPLGPTNDERTAA